MIDVVHTKQGKSFRGLVAYLLEGSKGAENPERVAWTETRNLATHQPMVAAHVMAATALEQHRIMREAEVPTRRKSSNHVLHYTLSWPEGADPSREEMMRAVNGSLAVLGETKGKKGGRKKKNGELAKSRTAVRDQFATEHQVLVVAHEDTDNAHCHVVVNRVHPTHGVLLPTSHDYRRLSRWAQKYDYEFNNGELAVPQRAINNARRDAGDRVYMKRTPRDVYELEQAANANHPAAKQLQDEQRAADRALGRKTAKKREEWKSDWRQFEEAHREERCALWRSGDQRVETARREAGETFGEQRATLFHEQQAAEAAFKRNENHLVGKAMNAIRSLLKLKGGVNVIWSQGARQEALDKALAAQKRELEARVSRAKEEAAREERARVQRELLRLGDDFRVERAKHLIKYRRRVRALRNLWRTREAERKAAWEEHRRAMEALPPEKRFGRQTITPDEAMKTAAEEHMRRMRRAREERDRQRGRDDDRGR